MTDQIARLRIALQDIEPEIWRRVEVPLDLNLKSLHGVIQAIFEWQNCHLFEFTIEGKTYGVPHPEEDFGRKIQHAKLAKLETLVTRGVNAFEYVYDMGDSWEHTITIEEVLQGQAGKKYPRFVDGARRGPPEDSGGFPGYYEFLKAVSSPRQPGHQRARSAVSNWGAACT